MRRSCDVLLQEGDNSISYAVPSVIPNRHLQVLRSADHRGERGPFSGDQGVHPHHETVDLPDGRVGRAHHGGHSPHGGRSQEQARRDDQPGREEGYVRMEVRCDG